MKTKTKLFIAGISLVVLIITGLGIATGVYRAKYLELKAEINRALDSPLHGDLHDVTNRLEQIHANLQAAEEAASQAEAQRDLVLSQNAQILSDATQAITSAQKLTNNNDKIRAITAALRVVVDELEAQQRRE
jgi:hypothetical protein